MTTTASCSASRPANRRTDRRCRDRLFVDAAAPKRGRPLRVLRGPVPERPSIVRSTGVTRRGSLHRVETISAGVDRSRSCRQHWGENRDQQFSSLRKWSFSAGSPARGRLPQGCEGRSRREAHPRSFSRTDPARESIGHQMDACGGKVRLPAIPSVMDEKSDEIGAEGQIPADLAAGRLNGRVSCDTERLRGGGGPLVARNGTPQAGASSSSSLATAASSSSLLTVFSSTLAISKM